MNTTLVFIRHGETDWNRERRWQGQADIPLNAAGREQARRLARRLSVWPLHALYSSPLARAASTAQILGDSLGLAPELLPAWCEHHVGELEGLTAGDMEQQFPALHAKMARSLVDPPGGETRTALHTRVSAAYEAILEQHEGEMVAVVSHGGVLYALLQQLLRVPRDRRLPLAFLGNTGLTTVEIGSAGTARITRLNDTAHLEIEGGSWA